MDKIKHDDKCIYIYDVFGVGWGGEGAIKQTN